MKNKILIILFALFIGTFSIYSMVDTDKVISISERRKLAVMPKYEMSTDYVNKLEKYLLDVFPLRDSFRSIKAFLNYKVFRKIENNNIVIKDDYIFKSIYPTDTKSIDNFIKYVDNIKNKHNSNNIYMAIIPDKNYYIDSDNFLNIDYDYLYSEINKLDVQNIDIRDILNIDDYYETDTHWRQEKLEKIVKHLSSYMNFNYDKSDYKVYTYDKFYGVLYGEFALKRKTDTINYLEDDYIKNAYVEYLENSELHTVYNESKLVGIDSYDVYLDGASSLIKITNNLSKNENTLVVYRDSFGSSLIPLLIKYYKTIYIIDNRYISSNYYEDLVNFNGADILILNSTLLVNNSYTLKG